MSSLGDVHVLVIDDNRQMRLLIRCLLRAGGINRVTESSSAAAALELINHSPFDLLLVDWKMEPMDGLAFTRQVRLASPNPYVPILMMTAHTEVSRVAAARDAGVTGFVKKPISARVLFERVANALTDAREFVRSEAFFGPDRRRGALAGYGGPFRRCGDAQQTAWTDTLDLDDMRWRA